MVSVGYEATVAPLGTALTADQLHLMWNFADEPTLCFDGDVAGRRAAYRAVDIALPLLRPGKSLKFASLPDGHDPDDLVRAGGREAVAEVIGAARPLAEMLWVRETEAGGFDTPERRAALETRIGAITAAIADDSVRKYYRRDLEDRLLALFRIDSSSIVPGFGGSFRRREGRFGARGGRAKATGSDRFASFRSGGPYVMMSPQLAASPPLRGHRAAIPRREALILQALLNHPWLAHDHLEELAALEFRHADTQKLKATLLDVLTHHAEAEPDALRSLVEAAGHGPLVTRVERAITTPSVWAARRDAAPHDVLLTWKQLVALHHQWHSLLKELRDAEQALGQDATEANYSWLQDVKARLSEIDGTEALIEGFGSASGRGAANW
jgi:DNA primase